MATGQPVEAGASQMEAAKQLHAARSDVDHGLLGLACLEKSEGRSAPPQSITDEDHCTARAGQHLAIDPINFTGNRRALGQQSIDFAALFDPSHRDLRFRSKLLGTDTLDIAAIGCAIADRN
jgi:hypothetical protein